MIERTEVTGAQLELLPGRINARFEAHMPELRNADALAAEPEFYEINFSASDIAYAALARTKRTNHLTVIDYSEERYAGYAEMLQYQYEHPTYGSRPYVEGMQTYRDYVRQGRGVRRLEVLGALTQHFVEAPLYSSAIVTEYSRRLFERLEGCGRAVRVDTGGKTQWRLDNVPDVQLHR